MEGIQKCERNNNFRTASFIHADLAKLYSQNKDIDSAIIHAKWVFKMHKLDRLMLAFYATALFFQSCMTLSIPKRRFVTTKLRDLQKKACMVLVIYK